MSTVKIKSTELVRKFADLKALIQETGVRIVVEEYKRPVLVVMACDEDGEPIKSRVPKEIEEMEEIRRKLLKRKIQVTAVNFT